MAGLHEYAALVLKDRPFWMQIPFSHLFNSGHFSISLTVSFFFWGGEGCKRKGLALVRDWCARQTQSEYFISICTCVLKVSLCACLHLISSPFQLILNPERVITQGDGLLYKSSFGYRSSHSWSLIHMAGSPPAIRHHLFAPVLRRLYRCLICDLWRPICLRN